MIEMRHKYLLRVYSDFINERLSTSNRLLDEIEKMERWIDNCG